MCAVCVASRAWSAAPVNAFTLWKPEQVKVGGEEHLLTFNKTPSSDRKTCKTCGGHVLVNVPEGGVVDVFAPLLTTLAFEPQFHMNYKEHMVPLKDGLPKFKDLPADLGGSGDTMDE